MCLEYHEGSKIIWFPMFIRAKPMFSCVPVQCGKDELYIINSSNCTDTRIPMSIGVGANI